MRLLLVEDDRSLAEVTRRGLTGEGHVVDLARDGREGCIKAVHGEYDVVILDIMLPLMNGYDILKEMRAKDVWTPVLMLTAKDGEWDQADAFDLGADDYLTKDVSLPHLTARINTLFRRVDALRRPQGAEATLKNGDLSLQPERMRVTWKDVEVPLTVTEFWMVHTLVRHPGHVKNRDQLMREAQVVVDDATITSHVKRIRRKFEALDPAFDEIDTVHGAGDRWRA